MITTAQRQESYSGNTTIIQNNVDMLVIQTMYHASGTLRS